METKIFVSWVFIKAPFGKEPSDFAKIVYYETYNTCLCGVYIFDNKEEVESVVNKLPSNMYVVSIIEGAEMPFEKVYKRVFKLL